MNEQQRAMRRSRLLPPTTAFGAWLDGLCRDRDLSLSELAKEMGVMRTTILHIRRGRKTADRGVLMRTLRLPGLTVEQQRRGVAAWGTDVLREVVG